MAQNPPSKKHHRKANGFGPECRLTGRDNFLRVLNGTESKRLRGDHCRIVVGQSDVENTRFGITVSRGVGPSVVRNRKKRIIREFLRNNRRLWPSNKMIIVRLDREIASEKELLSELEDSLDRMK